MTSYIGIPLYLLFIFGFKIAMKTKRVRPESADLVTGKGRIGEAKDVHH